jgi:organic hydroperoxide reductase OsmC/OhrA
MATRDTLASRESTCVGGADYAALALEALQEPADRDYASALMDRVSGDCQFTKDLAAVAIVYKELGDQARAEELTQTAEDYCMSGEEQVYLAEAKMKVLGDKAGAAAAFDKALKETNNLDPLIELAKGAMKVFGDSGVAKKVMEKAEGKIARAVEFTKLAAVAVEHLKDQDYAGAIFSRAAEKLSGVPDLLALAGEVTRTLGDASRARALYERAMNGATDFTAAMSLVEAARAANDNDFLRAALGKASSLATGTNEFIDLAAGLAATGDKAGATQLMDRAEEAVAGLAEMEKLTSTAQANFADDTARVERLVAKLEKRRANHARYLAFQEQEKSAKTVKQLLGLADRVATELEDAAYAAKLIGAAEQMLDAEGYQFLRYAPVIAAVDRNIDDSAWLTRLLDRGAENATDATSFKALMATLATLRHADLGRAKASAYLGASEAALNADAAASAYDFAKLAEAGYTATRDAGVAGRIVEAGRARAKDHYALLHLGKLYADMGESAKADELFAAAAGACHSGEACIQFIDRLKSYALSQGSLRTWYESCGKALSNPADKLRWAEGIADALNDKGWASEAYAGLAGQFKGDARFDLSRRSRAAPNYFGAARRH